MAEIPPSNFGSSLPRKWPDGEADRFEAKRHTKETGLRQYDLAIRE